MSDAIAPAAPAAAPAEAPAETKAPVVAKAVEPERTLKVIIDGVETEMTETRARTAIQKSHAAEGRMQAATEKQKKLDALLADFEKDPEAALAKLGKDPAKLIAEHLAKKAKLELMTPEQRDAEALRKERDEYKAKVDAQEKAAKDAKDAEAFERHMDAVQKQLVMTADKYGIEATPEALEGLAAVADELMDYLGRAPSLDQIAQEYQRRELEHLETRDKKILSKLEGKKLLTYLGKDGLAKVRAALAEADAESLKAIPAPKAKPRTNGEPHVRATKGHLSESAFDKKFGL